MSEQNEGACCACLNVVYDPEEMIYEPSDDEIKRNEETTDSPYPSLKPGSKMMRERWMCRDCNAVLNRLAEKIRSAKR